MIRMRDMILSMFVLAILLSVNSVYASLIDNGDGTITQVRDDGTILMWMQDANTKGAPTDWGRAYNWANNFSYLGFDDWRLPSALNSDGSGPCSGNVCTDSEMGYLFHVELGNPVRGPLINTGPFINLLDSGYGHWSGTEYSLDFAWDFHFSVGDQNWTQKRWDKYAWAVRDCPTCSTVVPEPLSSALFIVGGTLFGVRNYLRKIRT